MSVHSENALVLTLPVDLLFIFVESKCHLVGLKSPQICLPVGDFWVHLILSLGCVLLNFVDAVVSVLGN